MKTKNKEMLWNIFALVLVAVISIALTKIAFELYQNTKIYDVKEYNAQVRIADFAGFSINTDSLDFGVIVRGSSITRTTTLQHNYTEPLLVKVIYSGDIQKVLGYKEPFVLAPNTEMNLSITAYGIAAQGNYTGKVKIFFLKQ
ncbi:MAG TPA: hypothetical protein VKE88_00760 [Candidatus Nanoarchaeia archaeon]|nr:hypothetical protein [Candidatus Nanoarchaeia archaeon]